MQNWKWISVVICLTALSAPAGADKPGTRPAKADDKKTVADFIADLTAGDQDVAVNAAAYLGSFGPRAKEAVPALRRALKNDDIYIRIMAAKALAQVDPSRKHEAVLVLGDCLEDDESLDGQLAILALVAMKPEFQKIRLILERLKQKAPEVSDKESGQESQETARQLYSRAAWDGLLGLNDSVDVFQSALEKDFVASDWNRVPDILEGLVFLAMDSPAARKALFDLLKVPSGKLRGLVIDALRDLVGPARKEFIPALRNALEDPNPKVAVAASIALTVLDPSLTEASLAFLEKFLDDPRTRKITLYGLATFAVDAEFTLPLVEKIRKEASDPDVRRLAKQVEDKIMRVEDVKKEADDVVPEPRLKLVPPPPPLPPLNPDKATIFPVPIPPPEPKKMDMEPTDKENLRYDGKSFAQWRRYLLTELKGENRLEGIKAMAEFGNKGYPREATAVILEVISNSSRGVYNKIFVQTCVALSEIGEPAVPFLLEGLKNPKLCNLSFAILGGRDFSKVPKTEIPNLVKLVAYKESEIRNPAIRILALNLSSFEPEKVLKDETLVKDCVQGLVQSLKDCPSETMKVLSFFGPRARSAIPTLMNLGEENPSWELLETLVQIGAEPEIILWIFVNIDQMEKTRTRVLQVAP